jgi:hypothetical protein
MMIARDHEGLTPLHVAASWSNYSAIRKSQEAAKTKEFCGETSEAEVRKAFIPLVLKQRRQTVCPSETLTQ